MGGISCVAPDVSSLDLTQTIPWPPPCGRPLGVQFRIDAELWGLSTDPSCSG